MQDRAVLVSRIRLKSKDIKMEEISLKIILLLKLHD